MADEVDDEVFLNEFTRFLSQLPQTYEQLRLNQFTQALDIADNMLSASERTCSLCVIFLFLFECREDEISHEIVEKLQTLVGQYEYFTRRYMDVVRNLQQQETDNRFRCQNEPAYNENLRGRPRFRVTKAQNECLREIGFSWTKIAELIGVSRVTLGTLRFIGRQRNGKGKKTLYDIVLVMYRSIRNFNIPPPGRPWEFDFKFFPGVGNLTMFRIGQGI